MCALYLTFTLNLKSKKLVLFVTIYENFKHIHVQKLCEMGQPKQKHTRSKHACSPKNVHNICLTIYMYCPSTRLDLTVKERAIIPISNFV